MEFLCIHVHVCTSRYMYMFEMCVWSFFWLNLRIAHSLLKTHFPGISSAITRFKSTKRARHTMINAQTTKRECNAGIENGHRINQPIRTGLTIHLTECVLWPLTFMPLSLTNFQDRNPIFFFFGKRFFNFHDFPKLKIKFHDFPGLENHFWKSMTFHDRTNPAACANLRF